MKFSLIAIVCTLLLGCAEEKSNEVHKSVQIANVFPEQGLTDPHALVDNGKLYVFCGHDKSWHTDSTWLMDRWEIHSTTDLKEWKKEGEILPSQTYIGDEPNCWAGNIVKRDNKYYWYFSNRNINTGVMVADSPVGPWKDALGKPLLHEGIIGKTHPYDPTIFEENGEYSIVFGVGTYYAAKLSKDMISLESTPQPLSVVDKQGNKKWTDDKSTLFKRGNKYYLAWGGHYAMSDDFYGPYAYQGAFLAGGHNDVFVWKNQWYVVMENKDIGIFYRGVSLKPLNFNEDGTVIVPESDGDFPTDGRKWEFEQSTMAWAANEGTSLEWEKGLIKGDLKGHAIIESAVWLLTDLTKYNMLVLKLKNQSKATKARVSIASFNPGHHFWEKPAIDWEKEASFEIEISSNDTDFKEYKINLSAHPYLKNTLKRVRIEPALDVTKGSWELSYLSIESSNEKL